MNLLLNLIFPFISQQTDSLFNSGCGERMDTRLVSVH